MKKTTLLSILACLFAAFSYAQSGIIFGKLLDEKLGSPIEFANIKVLKTNKFSVSNTIGEFVIEANEGDEIEITHVSYKTINLKITNNQTIKLQSAQIELNEIIVSANPLEDIAQSEIIVDQIKMIRIYERVFQKKFTTSCTSCSFMANIYRPLEKLINAYNEN